MDEKGVTLIELLIVIVVLGIVSSIAVLGVTEIIQNQKEKADQHNAQFVADVIETMFLEGSLEVSGQKLYNTESGKTYTGTGRVFYQDLDGRIGNRIIIQNSEGRNPNNRTGDGQYRFRFRIRDNEVQIFYYDTEGNILVLATVETP